MQRTIWTICGEIISKELVAVIDKIVINSNKILSLFEGNLLKMSLIINSVY